MMGVDIVVDCSLHLKMTADFSIVKDSLITGKLKEVIRDQLTELLGEDYDIIVINELNYYFEGSIPIETD